MMVNYKRVERLYQKAQLQVRRRKRKKVLAGERQPLVRPARANQVWSMDFVFDRTAMRLNEHWFTSLLQARTLIEQWRRKYNEDRPKKALGGLTPSAYAERLKGQLR